MLQEAKISNRFSNPFPQFWSSTAPYSGGVLRFYATGTSTPLSYYTDAGLSTGSATTHTLNSAGRPTTNIWLQNVDYKITLEDSSGSIIWTADPVRASDFASFPLWIVGSGNPNGSVAGTAGSSGVMPTKYWDYTNSIEYTCTTTGDASSTVWTALNSSAATPSTPEPQGRLTLTSATSVLAADVSAATAVYYTPYKGNLIPIYNGVSMTPTTFAELTLTLASQHTLNLIYDVFVFSNSGTVTVATGPAWTTSTAGAGARGTGAGTTQLSRVQGIYVNTVSMTARNGATTYTIAANRGTYVGSIYIDGTAGQCSCLIGYGQSRKWGVWNAYNRVPIQLKMGDGTASWTYTTATIRGSRATAANILTTFTGLPEELAEITYIQDWSSSASATGWLSQYGIGINGTLTAFVGKYSSFSNYRDSLMAQVTGPVARYTLVPSIGINTFHSLEWSTASGTTTWYGTEPFMLMTARWNG